MTHKPKWCLQDPRGWTVIDTPIGLLEQKILEQAKQSKQKPAAVFDLDGTLFDVSFRTFAIIEDWVKKASPNDFPENIFARLAAIRLEDIGYSVEDSFKKMGFDLNNPQVNEVYKTVNKAWKKRFFDGKTFVIHDKPLPGALSFVRELHNHNIHIVYLSGRSKRSSYEGTLLQLEKAGFPVETTEIMLKEDESLEDHIFKALSLAEITNRYDVIANFENEYLNLATMTHVQSNALHTIVDAPHSNRPTPEEPITVRRITHFSKK